MTENEKYMRMALELAKSAEGFTNPNPMVGCVVVKEGKILAKGCHEKYGGYHAERNALLSVTEDVTGADLYVTLEPCCHHGKTPPCTDIIMEKGIGHVFVGAMDPNPKVGGKGIQILRDHGIQVTTGILEEECLRLNEIFFHYITGKMPFVAMKYAMTLDGKIQTVTGESQWITGEEARKHVHTLRRKYAGILVGSETVLADDPMLNCRIQSGVDPVRIICDRRLRIPVESQIVKTANDCSTIVATDMKERAGKAEKMEILREKGIQVWETEGLEDLLKRVGKAGIDSVLAEGGATLHGSLFKSGLVQRVYAYVAPKLVGGNLAKTPVGGSGIKNLQDALPLTQTEILPLGEDVLITGRV